MDSKHCLFALQVKPINEKLREVKGAKMMVDVVQTPFAPLKKVIQFVSGNALICETVKEAKHIAFDGPVRLKVRSRSLLHTFFIAVMCLMPLNNSSVNILEYCR